jgi:regulator of nonsense transcripts 1
VRTVDGFQGREKEVIVFSTVRANPERQLGFTADARRLNVAITRARRGLVVVGHRATLRSDPNWSAWLQWVDAAGGVLPLEPAEAQR